jgi:hypothetical protein
MKRLDVWRWGLALTVAFAPTVYAVLRISMRAIAVEPSPLAVLSTERSVLLDRCLLCGYVLLLCVGAWLAIARRFSAKRTLIFTVIVALSAASSFLQGMLAP